MSPRASEAFASRPLEPESAARIASIVVLAAPAKVVMVASVSASIPPFYPPQAPEGVL